MKDPIQLHGKSIVITGASSGVGKAAAMAFAQQGARLTLAARNLGALEDTADECRLLGAEVQVVPTDVTDAKAMISLVNAARDAFGQVDVWINNAGILAAGDFDKMPMEVHEQVIKTNLIGYMNGAHAVVPVFKLQQHGVLINNISIGGYVPAPYGAGYTASKFGLRGFSESLKGELTPWPEIHVCDLFPAFLDTPGISHAGNYTGKVLKPAPPVYDPNRVAQEMVRIAAEPRSTKYVGSASVILKATHALFPELTAKLTGFFMRRYLKNAPSISLTDGNVFSTVDHAMSDHGGFGLPGEPKAHRKYIAAALVAGLAAGMLLIRRS